MRVLKCLCVTVLLATTAIAHADQMRDVIFVGRMEKTTLFPDDRDVIYKHKNATQRPPNGSELQKIEVSNSCGAQLTELTVKMPLLGMQEKTGSIVEVTSRLGEWCNPLFRVSDEDVFVAAIPKDGKYEAVAAYYLIPLSNGEQVFYPEHDATIAGIDLWELLCPITDEIPEDSPEQPDFWKSPHAAYLVDHGLLKIKDKHVYLARAIYLKTLEKYLASRSSALGLGEPVKSNLCTVSGDLKPATK